MGTITASTTMSPSLPAPRVERGTSTVTVGRPIINSATIGGWEYRQSVWRLQNWSMV